MSQPKPTPETPDDDDNVTVVFEETDAFSVRDVLLGEAARCADDHHYDMAASMTLIAGQIDDAIYEQNYPDTQRKDRG